MTRRYQQSSHGNLAPRAVAALMALCMWSAVAAAEPAGTVAKLAGHRVAATEKTAASARTIVITSATRSVQVQPGETVRFDFGATSAIWRFAPDEPEHTVLELINLFPEIPAAEGVWVHLQSTRTYRGVLGE